MKKSPGTILVVDDDYLNRMLITTHLEEQGHRVEMAENGRQAVEMLHQRSFDVVLLDLIMPEMDGFQVLEHMKADSQLRHVPVIVISAVDEMDSVVRCIEMGAMDHLLKPFDTVFLRARINASLAQKHLHDLEQAYIEQINAERKKSENLLLNILPAPIAEELKKGRKTIATFFPEATVLFSDLVNFTSYSVRHPPEEVLDLLNTVFLSFDELADKHSLEKIKTIGDAYMVAGGIPIPRPNHVEAVAELALDMNNVMTQLHKEGKIPFFQIRTGIHTGPVVAGVIGRRKFAYDLWGDTVNTASRIQAFSTAGNILVSQSVHDCLKHRFEFREEGMLSLKGRGRVMTYWLVGRKN